MLQSTLYRISNNGYVSYINGVMPGQNTLSSEAFNAIKYSSGMVIEQPLLLELEPLLGQGMSRGTSIGMISRIQQYFTKPIYTVTFDKPCITVHPNNHYDYDPDANYDSDSDSVDNYDMTDHPLMGYVNRVHMHKKEMNSSTITAKTRYHSLQMVNLMGFSDSDSNVSQQIAFYIDKNAFICLHLARMKRLLYSLSMLGYYVSPVYETQLSVQ